MNGDNHTIYFSERWRPTSLEEITFETPVEGRYMRHILRLNSLGNLNGMTQNSNHKYND